mmetsp:Transcript_23370/g.69310  ORF Transcript_23370/g.69310 Transcript_23370/m.69310 type:complete len:262 (+) Transcript_23370:887-1672(+)
MPRSRTHTCRSSPTELSTSIRCSQPSRPALATTRTSSSREGASLASTSRCGSRGGTRTPPSTGSPSDPSRSCSTSTPPCGTSLPTATLIRSATADPAHQRTPLTPSMSACRLLRAGAAQRPRRPREGCVSRGGAGAARVGQHHRQPALPLAAPLRFGARRHLAQPRDPDGRRRVHARGHRRRPRRRDGLLPAGARARPRRGARAAARGVGPLADGRGAVRGGHAAGGGQGGGAGARGGGAGGAQAGHVLHLSRRAGGAPLC